LKYCFLNKDNSNQGPTGGTREYHDCNGWISKCGNEGGCYLAEFKH
jgi:hypothetical protein